MTFDPLNHLLELYETDPGNRFDDPAMGPLFDPPLVGVAAADDPWFARFKEIIGDFHWTPQEALELVAPRARARSVISWCLPVVTPARVTNRRETQLPSRNWAYVRTFGEQFVTRLRHGLEGRLRTLGFDALAPAVVPQCDVQVRPAVGISSRWSERHAAFAAGLGTFGLSGGLITRRGIAHRLGSVVTSADIPPTPRPYGDNAFAWCLKLAGERAAPASADARSAPSARPPRRATRAGVTNMPTMSLPGAAATFSDGKVSTVADSARRACRAKSAIRRNEHSTAVSQYVQRRASSKYFAKASHPFVVAA